ncbi:MAG: SDR family oxidoreductase [Acidimicrobiales bacterium]
MSRWKRALVTGASSGIGASIARQLAEQGTPLVVVARDEARLDALAADVPVDVEVLVADLADPHDVARIGARLASSEDPIDLLVNNAGLGFSGSFAALDYEKERRVVAVNVLALHELSHAAAATMVRAGSGGILNIASVAGYLPSAGSATYAATKAFVNSFSESLHQELAGSGVTVTVSCPGFTRTEFHERAEADASRYPNAFWQDADTVAASALAAVAEGKARVVPGALNTVAVGLLKVAPLAALRRVTGKVAANP